MIAKWDLCYKLFGLSFLKSPLGVLNARWKEWVVRNETNFAVKNISSWQAKTINPLLIVSVFCSLCYEDFFFNMVCVAPMNFQISRVFPVCSHSNGCDVYNQAVVSCGLANHSSLQLNHRVGFMLTYKSMHTPSLIWIILFVFWWLFWMISHERAFIISLYPLCMWVGLVL